jgi:hypothetical protein
MLFDIDKIKEMWYIQYDLLLSPQMDHLSCLDLSHLVVLATERGMKAASSGDKNTAILYLGIAAKLHDSIAETYASDELAANSRSQATRVRALITRYQLSLTSTQP